MPSDVELCAQALVLIGGEPIASLIGNVTEQVVAKTLYEDTVRGLLSEHRWRFASGQVVLNRLADAPTGRWDAAYQIPTNPAVLVINAVTVNDIGIDFDRYEDYLACNAAIDDVVLLDYTYRASEALWPAYFATAVKYTLAYQFALAIPDKIELAQGIEAKAATCLTNAKLRDSQGRTARPLYRPTRLLGGRQRIVSSF